MLKICDEKMCAGCMACIAVCPRSAISIDADFEYYRASIDQGICIDCGCCVRVCQQLNPSEGSEPASWYEGWALDERERSSSSSGGIASAIAREFSRQGGMVCACAFGDGVFGFDVASTAAEVEKFKGSKYVKSNPTEAYELVRSALHEKQKVLFIGLPCQVSAMRNYLGKKYAERFYSIDLICHGSPSPQMLETFLRERDLSLDNVSSISFRRKSRFQLDCDGRAIDGRGILDRYLIAFLSGLSYTENCYKCAYANSRRVADITLGDSWGTKLSDEISNGISLVLSMNEKGDELLAMANVALRDVDVDNAIKHNAQLSAPSVAPASRDEFIRKLRQGASFDSSVASCLPKECLRQDAKRVLSRLGLWEPKGA